MSTNCKRFLILPAIGLLLLLTVGARAASADSITYTLSTGNDAMACCSGPYETVTVTWNTATTATVTFDSLTNGGYLYLMGDGSSVDLNVNALTFNATATATNGRSGFTTTATPANAGAGNVDGFGVLNLTFNMHDGFSESATHVVVSLTNTSGTWANATGVLTPNANGAFLAAHAFACVNTIQNPCTGSSGAFATGYVSNGGAVSTVPEPVSLSLFGTGLAFLGRAYRRRKQI